MSQDSIEDIYMLSPMQLGMLFHELQSPGAGFYFNQLSCELQGALDPVAFERAWREVLDRHPVLRTAFAWEDVEEPLQVVCRGVPPPIERLDWRDLPAAEHRTRFDAFLEEDRRRGFNLAEAPLVRLTLLQTAGETFRFVFSHHHLLLDGWSLPIVLREAFALYQGHRAGRPPPLPGPPPFRDFIAWLQRRGLDGAEAFWRARLADFDSPTPLGIDRPGTGERREEREAVLSPESTARLLAFARQQQVTISTLVHGAWALLLSRYAGRREVLFGTTVSGRPPDLPGAGSMVGLLINTIPLRVPVPGDAPVGDWLRALQRQQLEAQAHEHAPLVRIQRWSGVPPPAPLFESLVVFENYPLDASLGEGIQGLRVQDVRSHERGHHPLVLVAGARRELLLRIFHDARRIDGAAAQRALDHLGEILERLAARPGGRLDEIDLLAPAERRQLIARSAGPAVPRPDACAHQLFADQAVRTPDAVALELDGAQLTYRQLHRRARQLAHHLRSLGAGPETIVGICAERSFELVAGIFGVLEAGAAYLPLDPSYPPERLALMVREAAPPLVLAQEQLVSLLPSEVRKVLLDAAGPEWDEGPLPGTSPDALVLAQEQQASLLPPEVRKVLLDAAGPVPGTSPDGLAYVIYTSGSTGRPKGTLLTHRGLCDIALTAIDALELGPGSRVLQAAALGFDTSVWEIFSTLLSGGTLCLAPREDLAPGPGLRALLARRGITTLTATPSLLAHTPADGLPALRTVVSGGEVCTPELAGRWKPGRRLLNAYGPTEVTVCATLDTDVDPAFPTLGRPLPNEQVYVLDERMEPAPLGVPGELFIGGVGVARGYLQRAALTAERFIPDPFSGQPGARLYRTGDVGRYLPDGRLEFLGRGDNQVKLRGYRIELGEIEAVFSAHPGVREVAVVLREDVPGQPRLVAYVAGSAEDGWPDRLKALARQKLPPHMVPAAVVALDVLPRAPSGKLDRRALPAPGATAGAEHHPPRTAAEQALAGIFGQVLGVAQVGVHDSFFELGGDSILSIQVISRAAQAGIRLTPRALFDHPTVARLAAAAGSSPAEGAEQGPVSEPAPLTPIAHRRSRDAGGFIPSDFPLAELDQAELDRAVARLGRDARALQDDLEDLYPLSPMQQGMLFHDAGSRGSGVYFNQLACELEGPLDPGAFERAWQQVVDRHTVLRTAFVWEGLRAPLQAVLRRVRPPIVRLDWRGVPPAEQSERFEHLLAADRRQGFDLAIPPLVRLALARTAEAKHLFLLSHHHLLLDGWSLPILLREVFEAYEAFGEGRPPPSGHPLPYRDHIAWLRRQDMAKAEAFWRRELAGFPAPTPLGLDRARRAGSEEGRGVRSRTLTGEATAALSALARRRGLTLNTWVQGAWALLLARYSGEDDVLFGATVSGRPPDLPAIESRIGLFINTLPVRVRAAPGAVLLPWLEALQSKQVELRQHEHAPLPRIHRWSEVPPALPLFESLVVFENYPIDEALQHGLSTLAVRGVRATGENDLPLMLLAIPGRALELRIVHDRQRFDGNAVERMLGHLVALLARMVDGPERRLAELSMLGQEEEAALLRAGRPLHGPAHPGEPVHRRFEAQAERSPQATAVTFEGRSLSYRELDARANQLAHRLRRLGVGPDVPVALAMERSLEMVVAILGVLKAGGTYVPLDPAYPSERLAFMLADARAPVLVTQPELSERLPRNEAQRVLLDSTWAVLAGEPEERPAVPVDPAHLAYVIYTSGSTGRPKGTQITHGNVSRLFDATRDWYDFGPGDVWTLFHSYAFDVSVWELWGALLYGGRLVVVPHWVSRSPEAFHGLLASEKVTVLNQTPSAFRQFIAEDERHAPGALALRLVIFAGEALELASLRPWVKRHGDRRPRLVNMYGITETTVHVTYRPLTRADIEGGTGSVIGRPLTDLELHVLDPQGRPAPVGVPGELYVGGPGLARGYLRRPELTAQRFIPHPFSGGMGERLYRTGDRARRLADGDVEYLGRFDHQVKIRGFRIELGEIEARLARHPAVRESVVVVREDAPGEKRLVAYASPRAGASLEHAEVRAWLARELPEHFLPSALVVLDALPLTVQGKIDRRALPAPSGARPPLSRRPVAPRTPREEMLASLWREVLRVDQVGVHDDFFELGGDSILGLQIASRATQAGHPLTPRQIFQHPTIAALAEVEGAPATATAEQGPFLGPEALERLVATISGEVEDLYPLTPMQHGMLLHSLSDPGSAVYVSQLSCEIEGPLDAGAFERAWQEAMERHAALRTSFHWEGLDRPLQAVLRRAPLPLTQEDWRGVDAAEQARRFQAALERERERGFTLSEAPLVRLALLRTGERSHRFVLTHHHLLWDGWSLPILLADVFAAYEGAPPRPPPPRFRDHVAWLERQDPGAAEQFWRRLLHGFTAPTPIRLEERRQTGGPRRAFEELRLPEEVTARLLAFGRQHQLTPNTVIQGAWALLLSRYGGGDDVVFGSTVAGRPATLPGVESMVGLFINTLPLRVQLPGDRPVARWLKEIQERQAEMSQYEHSPLALVQRWSQVPAGRPLFESIVVFENYPADAAIAQVLKSLTVRDVAGAEESHYPLVLVAAPGRELVLRLLHDPRRVEGKTIRRVLEHLHLLLEQLASGPERRLDEVKLAVEAMPASATRPASLHRVFVPPRTPVEELIAAIWAEILELDRVGAEDNFFELGGHSLLATRAISRLRQAFGLEIPVRSFFDSPTVAGMARAVIEARAKGTVAEPAPLRAVRPERVPLSFAQQRLWFLDQLEPGSAAYHMPIALRAEGALRLDVLERALGEVVRRHEVLRTGFAAEDGTPVQRIAPAVEVPVRRIDARHLAAEAREAFLRQISVEENGRPFDLACPPLLRLAVVELGDRDRALFLTMHHIVSDGWSIEVLLRELGALYQAFARGAPSPLPELPAQYADHAIWQRGEAHAAVLDRQLAYWRERLAGAPRVLELPADQPRPRVQAYRGERISRELTAELSEALRALGRREDATPFMTFLAALGVLLGRLAGTTDLLVAAPAANRSRAEWEPLIGFFINTLVLRVELSGGVTFRQLLARVRETCVGAYAHAEFPFERLVEALQPERDLSRTPLVQVMLNLFSLDPERLQIPGLSWTAAAEAQPGAKLDLTLYAAERDGRFHLDLVYNADLFEQERMAELLRQLEHVLAQIAREPGERIDRLSLVTPEAATALPDPDRPLPDGEGASLLERIAHQVAEAPDRIAVVDGRGAWTYRRLAEESGRLAAQLEAQGIQPGDVVAIHASRDASLVVALLGVLESGAAFAVLDPADAPARLARRLRAVAPKALIEMEEAGPQALRCRIRLPDDSQERSGLAYVSFTSGSTGEPKGIAATLRPLEHFLDWHCSTFGLQSSDRFSLLSGLAHDPLLRDVFTPLWLGATLCIPDPDTLLGGRLSEWMARERITVMHLTPATSRLLDGPMPSLRYAFFGGDVLERADVARLRALAPQVTCVNFYGATETPQAMGYHVVRDDSPRGRVPLGRGIEGAQLLVLDAMGRLAGVGELGEIHVRTPYLSRGYLNDAALTERRFLPGAHGAGMYRTGDLGRYLPGGEVEIAGRADEQLKLRGHRIEPGEIEAALLEHPSLGAAAVIAREDGTGESRLVAYVVPRDGASPPAVTLREHLLERLPDHLVPSAYVLLDALPLTPSRKLDRRALPAPPAPVEPEEAATAPGSPAEELLAGFFAEVLGVPRVGRHQHFFELGGHSLLATQVVARLRRALGVELPLRAIFEAPTVAALARRVESLQRALAAPPLVASPRGKRLPLSFAQERLWFLDRLQPGLTAYNMALSVRLEGELDAATLGEAIQALAQRHEPLRTRFESVDGQPVQRIAAAAAVPFLVEDLRPLPESERDAAASRRMADEANRPFDLASGPLARAALWRVEDEVNLLLIGLHHAVGDGWSLGVLVRDLAELYAARRASRAPALAPLPVQYADFSAWQRQWLQGDVLERQLAFWRQHLAGAPPELRLPADRPRPAAPSHRGGHLGFSLPARLVADLEALGREQGCTLFMTVLAALQALLHRYSGEDRVVVGTPIAGRTQLDTEGLIGLFANTLALCGDLSGEPTFRELLTRTRDRVLGAFAHQDLPFEKLVEALQPARALGRSPLFQVMLVLQSAPPPRIDLPGLRLSPSPFERHTARFDLTVELAPAAGGLDGSLEYSADVFDAPTARRILGHYLNLLRAAAATPDRPLHQLSVLEPEERADLLRASQPAPLALPPPAPLHARFEAQVDRSPDALAVTFEGQRLTYAELDARSNQLAHRLRKLGVGPEVKVALALERSIEVVVGILGVLKAGGAYVPLDPAHPRERLAFTLEDAGARVLVAQPELAERLALPGTQVVLLEALAGEPSTRPHVQVEPGQLAYVIYTSGSTGKPKGVEVTHANVSRLFDSTAAWFDFGPSDVWTLFHSYAFDFSVWELWGALLHGGRLAVVPHAVSRTPGALRALLVSEKVTVLNQTPSAFRQLAAADEAHPPGDLALRLVIFGGEALEPASLRPWVDRHGDQQPRLVNMYGITETTVHVTCRPLARADFDSAGAGSAIGRPIPDLTLHVLDRHRQPVPVGVPGELCVGGSGLARGYLGRPALTAERFVPDPFSTEPGARLYRSGDLARRLPDGDVEYLGRIDRQVKIRGFRIELGEIESALAEHPAIGEAAVALHRGDGGEAKLVAYVVGRGAPAPAGPELRQFLQGRLPEYMLPAAWVALAALPLTENGKVDRRALPPPGAWTGTSSVPPRSRLELELSQMFEAVLGVTQVGLEDDFFALGGHSLLAVRLVARIQERYGRELPLASLFQGPTVAELARLLRQSAIEPDRSPVVPIQPRGHRPPLFLVPPLGGHVLGYVGLARLLGPDQPCYGLEEPALHGAPVAETPQAMAVTLVEAMRGVQPRGPYHLCGWSFGGVVAFEMAQQLRRQGEPVALLALLDAEVPDGRRKRLDDAELLSGLLGGQLAAEELRGLEPSERMRHAFENLKQLGLPEEIDLPRLGALYDLARARYRSLDGYVPGPYPERIVLFRAMAEQGDREETLGWGAIGARVDVHEVPGSHRDLLQRPHLEHLAAKLRQCLDGAR